MSVGSSMKSVMLCWRLLKSLSFYVLMLSLCLLVLVFTYEERIDPKEEVCNVLQESWRIPEECFKKLKENLRDLRLC